MPTRTIGLIGGECTGKTTLAHLVAEDLAVAGLSADVVDDHLRTFVERVGRVPIQTEQAELMRLQRNAVAQAVDRSLDWVIVDPDPFMTAVYSVVYFDDDSLIPAGLTDLAMRDLIVWCRADIPWIADGIMRDGDHIRMETEAVIADILADSTLPVTSVTGTQIERRDLVRQVTRHTLRRSPL